MTVANTTPTQLGRLTMEDLHLYVDISYTNRLWLSVLFHFLVRSVSSFGAVCISYFVEFVIVLLILLIEFVFLFAVQVCLSNPVLFSYLVDVSIPVILFILHYMVVLTAT